ncbi:centromere protein W-like protein [Conidiobolus coronatus NRRL 28638]|uniref:Centromere protein W-like protein n=1 Tax=Conidiobolus coronatus (strain ATCC 28846 / CBS 209.66 / NRRL 28638) TaxID=796925 RepID=A0A137P2D8_CONC2|nr:centromere protein W-like protein [Conidiobolus coronatus NRRL 28638]|eukprot:KXN69205.1 centromere protein W-like protein [Conidiobolus coronatus NRRL 28638]
MKYVYPTSRLRKCLKKHEPNLSLSKRAEVMVYLNYILFLKQLVEEAKLESRSSYNSNSIQPEHVERVLEKVLNKHQG